MNDESEFGGGEALTTDTIHWNYSKPQNVEAKSLLLTTGRVAIVSRWGSGEGVIAWCPLPKRNKKLEEELGL